VIHSMPCGQYFGACTGRSSTPHLRLIETTYAHSVHLPQHRHEAIYLCVMLQGQLREDAVRQQNICHRGTLIYNSAGEKHQDFVSEQGARCLNIEMCGTWVSEMVAGGSWPREAVCYLSDHRALAAVGRLESEFHRQDAASALAMEGLVLELIAEFRRGAKTTPRTSGSGWFRRVNELLHDRFAEPLGLEQLAKEIGVHPGHLARSFAAHHGCTIGEYVRRLRARHAYRQIVESDCPLAAIAARVGFSDQSHLTRVLRDCYGVTPAQLRRCQSRSEK